MSKTVIIVGAGQAGVQAAISLRSGGFDGRIILLGKEVHLPYQRPPLSKQVLKGEFPPEKCTLRQAEFLQDQNIEFRPGTHVLALNSKNRQIELAGDRVLDYDDLIIACGAALNRIELTGSSLRGVHYLRTIDEALALRECLTEGTRLVVAGAGYIGLEVAASARSMGCEVAVVEPQDHIMKRAALPAVADFLLQKHKDMGVKFHLGRLMTEILGGRQIQAVSLDDGTLLDADVLLKGIGVRPELDWLDGSDLKTERGILVDEYCRTNLANVYAAGDCAQTQHPLYTQSVVLESVQNAVTQGKLCAANILGEQSAYQDVPWFWSEQYDCRFQMAGLVQEDDQMVIRESESGSLSVLSLGADRLNAIQCINAPRDYMAARKIIAAKDQIDVQKLMDPTTNLKEMM